MLVSVVTLIALSLFTNGLAAFFYLNGLPVVITPVLIVLGYMIGAVIFSLGATLVSVFMKADLLDDEFLSFSEALGQWKKRFVPAFYGSCLFNRHRLWLFRPALHWQSDLQHSRYGAVPILYMILYPLAFLLGLLTVLVTIAVGF